MCRRPFIAQFYRPEYWISLRWICEESHPFFTAYLNQTHDVNPSDNSPHGKILLAHRLLLPPPRHRSWQSRHAKPRFRSPFPMAWSRSLWIWVLVGRHFRPQYALRLALPELDSVLLTFFLPGSLSCYDRLCTKTRHGGCYRWVFTPTFFNALVLIASPHLLQE